MKKKRWKGVQTQITDQGSRPITVGEVLSIPGFVKDRKRINVEVTPDAGEGAKVIQNLEYLTNALSRLDRAYRSRGKESKEKKNRIHLANVNCMEWLIRVRPIRRVDTFTPSAEFGCLHVIFLPRTEGYTAHYRGAAETAPTTFASI